MPKKYDVSVCIGRFQPFHNGQLAVLREALALAQRCVVVIGSAFHARTPKNPFTWQERAATIKRALTQDEQARVDFFPVRDYYDSQRWVRAVQTGVYQLLGDGASAKIVLVGFRKDASSAYLNEFADWTLHDIGGQGSVSATALREVYLSTDSQSIDTRLATLVDKVPSSTLEFLRTWASLPDYRHIVEECQAILQEKAQWAGSPYPPVFVTVDAIVRCDDKVLLIERGHPPGKGLLAIPGGFIDQHETVYQSAVRELMEETNLQLLPSESQHALQAVKVFDHPDRSLRGRVITHAHYFEFPTQYLGDIKAGDDAASAQWIPIAQLTELEDRLHDDHFHILDSFLGLLAS